MTNQDLEHYLREGFSSGQTSTIPHVLPELLLQEAVQEPPKRQMTFLQFIRGEIRFLGWKLWGAQTAAILVLCWILHLLFGDAYWAEPRMVIRVLTCLSLLVASSAIPLLYRSVRFRMQEIEAATYFSSARLLLARLLLLGTGDTVLLCALFLTTAASSILPISSALIALCLPFLLGSSGILFLASHVSPHRFLKGSLALCGVLLLTFSQIRLPAWNPAPALIALCFLLLLFCYLQINHILQHSAFAELQVT